MFLRLDDGAAEARAGVHASEQKPAAGQCRTPGGGRRSGSSRRDLGAEAAARIPRRLHHGSRQAVPSSSVHLCGRMRRPHFEGRRCAEGRTPKLLVGSAGDRRLHQRENHLSATGQGTHQRQSGSVHAGRVWPGRRQRADHENLRRVEDQGQLHWSAQEAPGPQQLVCWWACRSDPGRHRLLLPDDAADVLCGGIPQRVGMPKGRHPAGCVWPQERRLCRRRRRHGHGRHAGAVRRAARLANADGVDRGGLGHVDPARR